MRSRGDFMNLHSRAYTPDLFSFRTELYFIHIMFLICDSLVYAIEHSEFYNYFDQDISYRIQDQISNKSKQN